MMRVVATCIAAWPAIGPTFKGRRTGLVMGLLMVMLAAPGAASASGALDQSQVLSDGLEGIHSIQQIAQTFRAGASGTLDQVDLLLAKQSLGTGPGDLIVQIRAVAGGMPSSTVLASATLPQTSVPTFPFTWVAVPIRPAVQVTSGSQYAIAIFAPNAFCGTECYYVADASGDPYPAGAESSSHDGGVSWTPIMSASSPGYDMAFKTYVSPSLPTSKDQCKDGGWRNYPQFKNQGDCVSFVATHGK